MVELERCVAPLAESDALGGRRPPELVGREVGIFQPVESLEQLEGEELQTGCLLVSLDEQELR